MLTIVVEYKIRSGETENFFAALKAENIGSLSRKEDGCKTYDYYLKADDDSNVLLLERWESVEKWQKHTKTEHFLKLTNIKNRFVIETNVTRFNEQGDI